MIKLRVAQLAKLRGLNMNRVALRSGIPTGTIRRYWYGTRDGRKDGDPILEVRMDFLEKLANLLEIKDVGQFFDYTED